MSRPVRVHRLAEIELTEAAQYYEAEHLGLGAAFVSEAERALAAIVESPELGQIVRGTIRRRLLHRFPYGIIYAVHDSEIRVLAIMNLHRRPAYWAGRS